MRNEPQRRKGHKERKFGAALQSNDINPSVLISRGCDAYGGKLRTFIT
ncbi:hypothetical protein [Nostoc sp.]